MKRVNKYILAATLMALPIVGNQGLRAHDHKAECAMAIASLLRELDCPAGSFNSIMQHIDEQEAPAIAELRHVDFAAVKAKVLHELQGLYLKKIFMFRAASTKTTMATTTQGSSLRRFIAQAVTTAESNFQQFLSENSEEIFSIIEETLKQYLEENQRISDQAISTIIHSKSLENMCKNWKSIQDAALVEEHAGA